MLFPYCETMLRVVNELNTKKAILIKKNTLYKSI